MSEDSTDDSMSDDLNPDNFPSKDWSSDSSSDDDSTGSYEIFAIRSQNAWIRSRTKAALSEIAAVRSATATLHSENADSVLRMLHSGLKMLR